MPEVAAATLLVWVALVFAVLSFAPPLPHWLLGVAVVLLCVALVVGR